MAGFRTVVINKRCKLESLLGSLLIRSEIEERIHIKEIETLIIESTAVALTSSLVVDLTEAGVNIVFCNRRHLPCSAFLPVHSHFGTAKNIKTQIAWSESKKDICKKLIIKEKIFSQARHLEDIELLSSARILYSYMKLVADGDKDNYEARAAAVYFRALFGSSFSRGISCFENDALNYGYTLLLSTFAKEITSCGYLTELGIWHRGQENAFNLASDLMEPFRTVVDRFVYKITDEQKETYKRHMLKVLYCRIKINGENQSFVSAVRIYCHRVFRYLKGEVDDIFRIEFLGEGE